MLLVWMRFGSLPGAHVVEAATRQFSIVGNLLYREKDVAACVVSNTLVDEAGDRMHHVADVICCLHQDVRRTNTQPGHIFLERLRIFARDSIGRYAFKFAALDDLVVYVGVIHHVGDVVAAVDKVPADHVEPYERSSIPDVDSVVDRRPTHIDVGATGLARPEIHDVASHGVIYANSHEPTLLINATAYAAMPSPRPVNPSPSVVVALTDTAPGSISSAPATALTISSRSGLNLGAAATTVESMFSIAQPSSRNRTPIWERISRLDVPSQRSSLGNRSPRSPKRAAPSSASATAWQRTSASECPASPGPSGIRIPPITSGRLSSTAWASNPNPTLMLRSPTEHGLGSGRPGSRSLRFAWRPARSLLCLQLD